MLIMVLMAAFANGAFAKTEVPAPQNVYARNVVSLNGNWNYFVDVQEQGYYDYRENLAMLDKIEGLAGTCPWVLMDYRSPRRPLAGFQDLLSVRALSAIRDSVRKPSLCYVSGTKESQMDINNNKSRPSRLGRKRDITFYDDSMTYSKNTPDFLPHT